MAQGRCLRTVRMGVVPFSRAYTHTRQPRRLLQRRHVKIGLIQCIGKESNSLESVNEGLEHSEKNVYAEYADPSRTEWIVKFSPR